jgi:sigma-B regulation protein RsbU (phosphoserine phosphatase)
MSTKTLQVIREDNYEIEKRVVPGVLRSVKFEKKQHLFIEKIASCSFYALSNAKVIDVYNDLHGMEQVQAVGIVDNNLKILGIIVRKDFFSILSMPYARDVMKNRTISDMMDKAEVIDSETNLFTVAEIIKHRLREPDISYFVITDKEERFKGIFSTRDMLIHLSDMTQNDIALAKKLQARLVKESDFVTGRNFEFVAAAISAKGVAGDFYAIKKFDKHNWIITVCDVSGKGVAASIITSIIWGMISIYDFRNGMQSFIERLNSYLFQTFESEKFVTGIFIQYNDESRLLRICDMGHAYIHLFRNGKCMRIKGKKPNLPLGILPGIEPFVSSFKPEKGDMFFIYTDGLIDQENSERETYSIDHVCGIISENHTLVVDRIKELVLDDFSTFKGDRHFNDDITFALIKFEEQDVVL